MELGVIADTHDNVPAAERAVEVFEAEGIEVVCHCGDFVAPPVVPTFEGFEFHGVLGNNDGELDGLELAVDDLGNGSELHGRYADLAFDGTRVAMLHGDQGTDAVEERAESGAYDYVLYGHFHAAECRTVGDATVVNPGAHFPTVPAGSRSVAIVDTDADGTDAVRFVPVEAGPGD